MDKSDDADSRLTARGVEMHRLLCEQARSGVSMREFATRRGMNPGTFVWWKREIGRRLGVGAISTSPSLIPVRVVGDKARPSSDRASFVVELANARRIEVRSDFAAEALRRLIEVVESC